MADAQPSEQPLRSGTTCLCCGTPLAGLLERLGSLRCDECRDAGARIDPALVPDSDPSRMPR